jgi:hypothetical protein
MKFFVSQKEKITGQIYVLIQKELTNSYFYHPEYLISKITGKPFEYSEEPSKPESIVYL